MPLTRQQKEEVVAQTSTALGSATAFVLITFNNLTVAAISQLRDNLHQSGGRLRIVPKRLLKIIFQQLPLDFDPLSLTGQVAIAWADDAVTPAKILNEFARQHPANIQLMIGSLAGEFLTLEQVQSLAALPSRDQLLGQFVAVIVGPTRACLTVLSGVQRRAVQVLQAIADTKTA